MKNIFLLSFVVFLLSIHTNTNAQGKPRISPKDSVEATLKKDLQIKIVYSKPSLRGRLLKNIITFDEVWRTGANEATTFEVNKNVTINEKELPAGKYSLYTIPGDKKSVVIFNKIWDQWGTKYDSEEDQLRVNVETKTNKESFETFTIDVSKTGTVSLKWGKMQIAFKVRAK